VGLSWDGEKHDATPTTEAPFGHADAKYLLGTDFAGAKRAGPISGAVKR
jgi:hypothetical protein